MSIQPAMAYEDESVLVSRPLYRWPDGKKGDDVYIYVHTSIHPAAAMGMFLSSRLGFFGHCKLII